MRTMGTRPGLDDLFGNRFLRHSPALSSPLGAAFFQLWQPRRRRAAARSSRSLARCWRILSVRTQPGRCFALALASGLRLDLGRCLRFGLGVGLCLALASASAWPSPRRQPSPGLGLCFRLGFQRASSAAGCGFGLNGRCSRCGSRCGFGRCGRLRRLGRSFGFGGGRCRAVFFFSSAMVRFGAGDLLSKSISRPAAFWRSGPTGLASPPL